MIFYESDSFDPYYNLALEGFFFEEKAPDDFFLLWQNDKTIVVGKFQNTAEEINRTYVEEQGIRVARRLTGGGAVYHDLGNLNYTFITGIEEQEGLQFEYFTRPVVRALASLGITAEFNSRNDLTINGKKFCGNAQCIRAGRLLHHGCIMVDSDLSAVSKALQVKEAKFESKAVKSVRSRVTTISAEAQTRVSVVAFKEALQKEILTTGALTAYEMTDADREAVEHSRETRYATVDWNWGRNPKYSVRKERKFDAGLIAVWMEAEHNKVTGIRFYGDFFGNGEIAELESCLCGKSLDTTLPEALGAINVGHYINGLAAQDLADLLLG